ncbi:MAG: methionyl aminopeptidase [Lachnospiraceae bacterium]|nr:methionyl aminopeptidase [Lachnospiraceae bacterium]
MENNPFQVETEVKLGRNDDCWCGSGKKYKKCHCDFDARLDEYRLKKILVPPRRIIKSPEQVEKIRESAKINIEILDYIGAHIKAGVTTQEIDDWVCEITKKHGAVAATLNFQGFPKSVCTSINNVVCHGIPSHDEVLKEGDIINVDASTIYNGYYSDSSRMYCIGEVSAERKRLVEVTKQSLDVGLQYVQPWRKIGDMGAAINAFAMENGYSVVRQIGGHGVGLDFHEDPWVSYVCPKDTGMLMVPGMMFTIEPMINIGRAEIKISEEDGWTVYTEDGTDSAQWEIQVLVTEDGYEIISY